MFLPILLVILKYKKRMTDLANMLKIADRNPCGLADAQIIAD